MQEHDGHGLHAQGPDSLTWDLGSEGEEGLYETRVGTVQGGVEEEWPNCCLKDRSCRQVEAGESQAQRE